MSTLPIKATYLKFNETGNKWETYYFQTSADLVAETDGKKFLSETQKTQVIDYLNPEDFNKANKLIKADGNAKIPASVIPTLPVGVIPDLPTSVIPPLPYLSTGGGTVSGNVMSTVLFEAPTVTATTRLISPEFRLPGTTNWRIFRSTDGLEIVTGAPKMQIAASAGNTSYLNGNWQMDASYTPNNIRSIVNKGYVDNLGMGVKPTTAVRVASTGNVALTGVTSIDGVTLANGDRVLLKDQETASQRGIYTWKTGGTLTKASVTGNDNQNGTLVRVTAGTANKNDTFYAQDYTAGNWILFDSNLELIPGAGITVSGATISIGSSAITNAMLAGSIQAGKINLGAGLSNISNAIGISSGAITNAMLAGSIEHTKIADIAVTRMVSGYSNTVQAALTNFAPASLDSLFSSLFSAIRALRGTNLYNTDNTQTIAGAYSNAAAAQTAASNAMAAIPKITSGTTPPTTGNKNGDLFFKEL